MTESDHTGDIQNIALNLSKAWEFLSGEERLFQHVAQPQEPLPFADFSFYVPLTLPTDNRRGGVGVLIRQDDAIRVATNMFGMARHQIHHDDLRDACSEVCNVFTDCMTALFGCGRRVKIGLPRQAGSVDYQFFAESCVTRALYQGGSGSRKLLIVLFDNLHSPS